MTELKEETSTQKIYWDEENEIVWGVLNKSVQTLEDAKENINAQEKIRDSLQREKIRVLIELDPVTKISKEARDYYANNRTAAVQRATALLVSSPIATIIANFFMGLNKPKSPTKMFTNSKNAINWLHTFPND